MAGGRDNVRGSGTRARTGNTAQTHTPGAGNQAPAPKPQYECEESGEGLLMRSLPAFRNVFHLLHFRPASEASRDFCAAGAIFKPKVRKVSKSCKSVEQKKN